MAVVRYYALTGLRRTRVLWHFCVMLVISQINYVGEANFHYAPLLQQLAGVEEQSQHETGFFSV